MSSALPWAMYSRGTPRIRVSGPGRPCASIGASMASTMNAPAPPWRTPSSAVTTSAWRAARRACRRRGATRPGCPTPWRHAFGRQQIGRLDARRHELADPERQTEPSPLRTFGAASPEPTSFALTWRGAVLGKRMVRARAAERGAQHGRHLLGRRRGEHGHAGDGQGQGHVEDAVMARAVVAGDAGPVEDEDDRAPVEADIEIGLVEGPAEEGRVHRHHGPDAGHRHARGRGDLVLLGDAHVEEAVGEAGLEGEQPGRPGHGRRQCHDAGVVLGRLSRAREKASV